MKRVLITGGAGFAGSNIALDLKQHFPSATIIAFDNLKRRGSELALPRLKRAGIEFIHGDVRVKDDLLEVGAVDWIIDCSAEPSVLAGRDGAPEYVVQTNLNGTLHCLELARIHGAKTIFLSTSRVYPIAPINALRFTEEKTRFSIDETQDIAGASGEGISESFPLEGVRSLYGATKLCSEHMLLEYLDMYGLKAVINRCGVLTGPWQMGKVDQGVVVLWVAKHIFNGKLSYIGYNGTGKQVRDILHIGDLCDLLRIQIADFDRYSGGTFNVGGGVGTSVSLLELTELCRSATKRTIPITTVAEDRPGDMRSYLSDCRKIQALSGWRPKRQAGAIIEEIAAWITDHKIALEPILG